MLWGELQTKHMRSGMFYFMLNVFLILCKFSAQLPAYLHGLFHVMNWAEPPKDHHTFYIQSPLTLFSEAFVINTVGSLVTLLNRINLMTFLCSMKIKLPILFAISVIHGNSIGISIISN